MITPLPKIFIAAIIIGGIGVAFAAPQLNRVTSGNATVTQKSNFTEVTQTSPKAIIEWNSFNIGAAEHTHFQQPANGVALNRINANMGASTIYGKLTATGKIILINPAGIHFGAGAFVDVGGIIASTTNMSNENFLAGKYIFDQPSTYNGAIVNEGLIRAANHGLVALVGNNIENHGIIQAQLGNIVLASGNTFTIDLYGDQLINFSIDAPTSKGKIIHTGTLLADGGTILISAKTAANIIDNVINMSGIAQARSVQQYQGQIILTASQGKISVSGKITTSGKDNQANGGIIKILAKNIDILPTALLDSSGDINGGTITIFADDHTRFSGSILAQGGATQGDGGSVEVSGKKSLDFQGKVDVSAPHGHTGTLLLDPENLTIQAAGASTATVAGGTVTANTDNSILTIADLQTLLTNANVFIQTGNGGAQAGDITIADAISWNNANSLTLSAYRNININAPISNHTGGKLVLQSGNSGNFVGTVNFGNNGSIYMGGGGQVNIYYNSPHFNVPINFSPYVSVGTNSTFTATLLNSLTPSQNAAVVSNMTQMTSTIPESSAIKAKTALTEPTPAVARTTPSATKPPAKIETFENNLAKVSVTQQNSVFKVDPKEISECKAGATCTMKEFSIE